MITESMKVNLKKYIRKIIPILGLLGVYVIGSFSVQAASCDTTIREHIAWLNSPPSSPGVKRYLNLEAVSNSAFFKEGWGATYLVGSTNINSESPTTLSSSSIFMYNSKTSSGIPFDSRARTTRPLNISGSFLELIGTASTPATRIPIDCDGFLIVGTQTTFTPLFGSFGRFMLPIGETKYLITLTRMEFDLI